MSSQDPLYDCFEIILKKVPENHRDFLKNVRSNSRNQITPPSIGMLTRLHKQVIKKTFKYLLYFEFCIIYHNYLVNIN